MKNRFRVSSLIAIRLQERQVSLPMLLRHAGLPAEFLNQDKVFATTEELFALWRSIGETSKDPGIGLKLGSESRLERFDPAAIAALCSSSFRDALQRMARYKQLTCPEKIHVHIKQNEAAVEFEFLQAEQNEPTTLVDACLAWIYAIGSRGTDGKLKPLCLELKRPATQRDVLEKHFSCPIRFKSARNAIVFRSADLDLPFVTHNAELLSMIGSQLDTELDAQQAELSLPERVKQTLKRTLAGQRPVIQHVARELGVSPRTLQRRLTDDGFTFQQLVEAARRELARHYLGQDSIELNEAAYLLGYEDANSFFRAFQNWEGTTPGNWRAQFIGTQVEAM